MTLEGRGKVFSDLWTRWKKINTICDKSSKGVSDIVRGMVVE